MIHPEFQLLSEPLQHLDKVRLLEHLRLRGKVNHLGVPPLLRQDKGHILKVHQLQGMVRFLDKVHLHLHLGREMLEVHQHPPLPLAPAQ